jgi:hypothetical protein
MYSYPGFNVVSVVLLVRVDIDPEDVCSVEGLPHGTQPRPLTRKHLFHFWLRTRQTTAHTHETASAAPIFVLCDT